MTMRMRRYLGLAAMAVLLCAGCDRGGHPSRIGVAAPEFSLADGGHTYDLKKMRGSVVLLNFWGPWCPPCLEELPSLMELQRQMPEIKVLAIGVPGPEGTANADETAYRQFLSRHSINLLTAYDGDERVNHRYGTVQFPETYIIDKKGVLQRKFVGAQTWNDPEIVKYLQKLAAQQG